MAAAKPLNTYLHTWICTHVEQWSNKTAEDVFKVHILVLLGHFFLFFQVGSPSTTKSRHYVHAHVL